MLVLLWCLLPAAIVFYIDGSCDPADDEGHPPADQIKSVRRDKNTAQTNEKSCIHQPRQHYQNMYLILKMQS